MNVVLMDFVCVHLKLIWVYKILEIGNGIALVIESTLGEKEKIRKKYVPRSALEKSLEVSVPG